VPAKPRNKKSQISIIYLRIGTNIQKALVKAIDIAHTSNAQLALVVLLTDGETTVGESEPSVILKAARDSNRREHECKTEEGENENQETPCSKNDLKILKLYTHKIFKVLPNTFQYTVLRLEMRPTFTS